MKKILCLVLFAFPFAVPTRAIGCTIPVFRYALEKWELTAYEILVFHKGDLPADLDQELKKWEAAPNKANVEISRVDVDGKMTKYQERVWQKEGDAKNLPHMIVRYSAADAAEPSSWTGPGTVANLHAILDSPMRVAIRAHLTRGASTVFIVLVGDDEAKDRAALDMVTRELSSLEKKIKIPAQSDDGPKIKLPIPLKVSFPVLVLDRRQPEEAAFIRLLLGTEDRLADVKGPMVFPVFGRGRVLGSLIGDELRPDQMMEVAKFLCRECSCQVKELNPGIDMVMSAEWNALFDQMYDGKEPIQMPAMSPAYLTPLAPAPKAIEKVSIEISPESAPARDVKAITTKVGAPGATTQNRFTLSVTPPAPAVERAPLDVRFVLWLGIGIACGLVLLSGGWLVYQVRK